MIRHLPILFSLFLFNQLLADESKAEEADLPRLLIGKVNEKQISLSIMPADAKPITQKVDGTRFINVEPGCIMLEAFCDPIDGKKLRIRMPNDGYFTEETMRLMGVKVKDVVVEFEPSDKPNLGGKIVRITPFQDKEDGKDSNE